MGVNLDLLVLATELLASSSKELFLFLEASGVERNIRTYYFFISARIRLDS